jgi:hypothetical protein
MSFEDQAIPVLSDTFQPPVVRGTADLTNFAYQGNGYDALMERIDRSLVCNSKADEDAARTYDAAIVAQLSFRRSEGLDLQDAALLASQVYRIGGAPDGALRLLALVGPGDLMTNSPLDFITNYLNVRLDLLYVLPDQPLPSVIPDHDVAFFALGEPDPATFQRLIQLYSAWPRPALNNPEFLPVLQRDVLPEVLCDVAGLCSPTTVGVSRATLDDHLEFGAAIEGFDSARGPYPCLIRPVSSHAGTGLSRLRSRADLADYLRCCFHRQFFMTAFEDYSSPDGLYRKSRVAFIDRRPFLCHMAISNNWMVHYLNAGMIESAEKRAAEAQAMAAFDDGFARRHSAAFDTLHERLGLDYYSIDCAETHDGRLLLFEADAAAIIHLMDPPELFPYKQPQMHKVFAAFDAMLHSRADRVVAATPPADHPS